MNTTRLRMLNSVLNKLLSLDIQAPQHLSKLAGKSLQIQYHTNRFEKAFFVVFNEQGVQCLDHLSEPASVSVTGPLEAFVKLALTKNIHAAAQLGLSFSGDNGAIEELQALFFSLDIEWEEYAAEWMGDTLAHQMGNWIRWAGNKKNRIVNSTARSLSEYLTEETKTCPTHYEINAFMNAVDHLRAGTERLELRMTRLQTARTAAE